MTQNVMKRTLAGLTALLSVTGNIPAVVRTTGLFAETAIVVSADELQ